MQQCPLLLSLKLTVSLDFGTRSPARIHFQKASRVKCVYAQKFVYNIVEENIEEIEKRGYLIFESNK